MAQRYVYSPETIIKAYALGLFPMAESHNSTKIRFYDPGMRGLIPLGPDLLLLGGAHLQHVNPVLCLLRRLGLAHRSPVQPPEPPPESRIDCS